MKLKIKKKNVINYADIKLAINLFRKIEIYYESSKDLRSTYITKNQYKMAKKMYAKIIKKKKINKLELDNLEEKVLSENKLIFSFLKGDLKKFSDKHKEEALKILNKLSYIQEN